MITPRGEPADPTAIGRHYDDLDPFYRELWGEHLHHGYFDPPDLAPERAVEELVDRVADAAGVGDADRVFDVGCGYGATARRLAEGRGARVTGITLSRRQLAHARTAASVEAGSVRYLLGDWLEHPVEPAGYDRVVSIEALEHMADKVTFFERALEALRPGGRIAATAWASADEPRRWKVRHLLEPICREGRLPGLGTASDYLEAMRRAGFEEIAIRDWTDAVRPTWSRIVVRVARGVLTRRDYRRFLLDREQENRIFALTVFRIRLAYATGAMRYVLLSGRRRAA